MTRIIQNWMIIANHEKIIQIWMIIDGRIRTYLPQYISCIPLYMPWYISCIPLYTTQYIDYSKEDSCQWFVMNLCFSQYVRDSAVSSTLRCRVIWSWLNERPGSKGTPQSHDYHMTVTWLSHDRHMTITWQSHDHHMTVTWPSHDRHMTVTW